MKRIGAISWKILKWTLLSILGIFILANLFIVISGKTYIYKAVACTYLVGQSGPGIRDLDYFPKREVEQGTPEPWPTHSSYGKVELSPTALQKFNQYKSTSLLVFKNDSLLFEHYAEDFGPTTISNSFSVAKSIVSILVGIAIDEHKIKSVDQPVGDFIPAFREGSRSKLTLYHLLTMSAGLDWSESGGNPLSSNAEAYYGSDLLSMINSVEVVSEPGKVFDYQSGATLILGYCVEKATNTKLSYYASEKLWKKIGAENLAYWSLDAEDGIEKSYCCFYAAGRDFARFGKLYLHQGEWNGTQIVSSEWVKKSTEPADLLDTDGSKNDRYGYCWWITEYNGKKVFYMRGILGQYVICVPDDNVIIVRTGHKRGDKRNDQPLDLFDYLNAGYEMIESIQ
ncbi:MAG: beta-lactamase family protein [Flavobacteriales bacterium]|nr:beta-lactamase family protein [Flavobacteriales bacterium]